MYHYVRELAISPYPRLKARAVDEFGEQLDYFLQYYSLVTMQECIDAVYCGKQLPRNALLLTFDDGYLDHYKNVFPILQRKGVQGSFFVPGRAVAEQAVLAVNKIQFILAAMPDVRAVVQSLYDCLDDYRDEFDLLPSGDYYEKLAKPDYFDTAEVVFIKKMLSMELPLPCRERIVNRLFARHVTEDEAAFARGLYLKRTQMEEMVAAGMYIGCHGYNHLWLGEIPRKEQEQDIDRALDFLDGCGIDVTRWAITYPYESYNASLLEVVSQRGCRLGFIEGEDIAAVNKNNVFEIVRLDTNEFPLCGTDKPNRWTQQVI